MSTQDNRYRVKRMFIHRQPLCNLFCYMAKRKHIPWTDELPEDVTVVNVHYDAPSDCFALVLSSAEFPKIKPGQTLEEITPHYQWVEIKDIGTGGH